MSRTGAHGLEANGVGKSAIGSSFSDSGIWAHHSSPMRMKPPPGGDALPPLLFRLNSGLPADLHSNEALSRTCDRYGSRPVSPQGLQGGTLTAFHSAELSHTTNTTIVFYIALEGAPILKLTHVPV